MTEETTSPSPSTLHEKIAKISAKLEQATPKFNGAMSVVSPTRASQPVGRHAKPWSKDS